MNDTMPSGTNSKEAIDITTPNKNKCNKKKKKVQGKLLLNKGSKNSRSDLKKPSDMDLEESLIEEPIKCNLILCTL